MILAGLEIFRRLEGKYAVCGLEGDRQLGILHVNDGFLAFLGFDAGKALLVHVNLELEGR